MKKILKNEFKKLLHKKTIHILLIIIICIIIINTRIGISIYDGIEIDHSEEALHQQEEKLTKQLNENNEVDKKIEIKTELDLVKLQLEYSVGSWQYQAIIMKMSDLRDILYNINFCTEEKNDEKLEEYKNKYAEIIKPMKNDNWKQFAQDEIKRYQNNISELNKQKEKEQEQEQTSQIDEKIKQNEFEIKFLKIRLEKDISFENNSRDKLLRQYKDESKIFEKEYSNYTENSYKDKLQYNKALKSIKELEYKINKNVKILNADNSRDMLMNSLIYYEALIVFSIIVISGTIVSDEFTKGTIKLLLIKPYKRWKILLGKLITCIIMICIIIFIIFVVQFIAGGIVYNFSDYMVPIIEYNFNNCNVETINVIQYIVILMISKMPMYIIISCVTFMLSIMLLNSSIPIILSVLIYLSKNLINLNENLEFVKYLFIVNWDFSKYMFGNIAEVSFLNKGFSLCICLINIICICGISFFIFSRKDIKNI